MPSLTIFNDLIDNINNLKKIEPEINIEGRLVTYDLEKEIDKLEKKVLSFKEKIKKQNTSSQYNEALDNILNQVNLTVSNINSSISPSTVREVQFSISEFNKIEILGKIAETKSNIVIIYNRC